MATGPAGTFRGTPRAGGTGALTKRLDLNPGHTALVLNARQATAKPLTLCRKAPHS